MTPHAGQDAGDAWSSGKGLWPHLGQSLNMLASVCVGGGPTGMRIVHGSRDNNPVTQQQARHLGTQSGQCHYDTDSCLRSFHAGYRHISLLKLDSKLKPVVVHSIPQRLAIVVASGRGQRQESPERPIAYRRCSLQPRQLRRPPDRRQCGTVFGESYFWKRRIAGAAV